MRVVIPGGSGLLGSMIAQRFHERGVDVVVLSRRPTVVPWRMVEWDGSNDGDWSSEIDGADVVVNLAGRSVNCRLTPSNRSAIISSRVDSTRAVARAIAAATRPPPLWLQAGTATIYSHIVAEAQDEATGILGGDEPGLPDSWRFMIDVGKAWEAALNDLDLPGTRRVSMRVSLVMSPERESVFDILMKLARRGLGGRNGSGRQFVSWIHYLDFLDAIDWLVEHEDIEGPVNMASPNPMTNSEFMKVIRGVAGASFGPPAAKWMLEIGAFFMRTDTELILKSRRVIPGRLLDSGFPFRFPEWPTAADDLAQRRAAN